MAANDGNPAHRIDSLFGIPLPDTTGAPGSAGDRTPPPGSEVPGAQSGIPGVGVTMALSDQSGPGESLATTQPGQVATSVISPGPEDSYTDTGAGGGHPVMDSSHRYPWQQQPGG